MSSEVRNMMVAIEIQLNSDRWVGINNVSLSMAKTTQSKCELVFSNLFEMGEYSVDRMTSKPPSVTVWMSPLLATTYLLQPLQFLEEKNIFSSMWVCLPVRAGFLGVFLTSLSETGH